MYAPSILTHIYNKNKTGRNQNKFIYSINIQKQITNE